MWEHGWSPLCLQDPLPAEGMQTGRLRPPGLVLTGSQAQGVTPAATLRLVGQCQLAGFSYVSTPMRDLPTACHPTAWTLHAGCASLETESPSKPPGQVQRNRLTRGSQWPAACWDRSKARPGETPAGLTPAPSRTDSGRQARLSPKSSAASGSPHCSVPENTRACSLQSLCRFSIPVQASGGAPATAPCPRASSSGPPPLSLASGPRSSESSSLSPLSVGSLEGGTVFTKVTLASLRVPSLALSCEAPSWGPLCSCTRETKTCPVRCPCSLFQSENHRALV